MAFSDGEVSCTPKDGSVSDTVVVDGPIMGFGQGRKPLRLEIENSVVKSVVDGDPETVEKLRRQLEEIENYIWFAEIAIGLNPCSLRNADFPEKKQQEMCI